MYQLIGCSIYVRVVDNKTLDFVDPNFVDSFFKLMIFKPLFIPHLLFRPANNGAAQQPSCQKIFELTTIFLVKLPLFCRENEILSEITAILCNYF